jgi:molybdopterin molybdotransferase
MSRPASHRGAPLIPIAEARSRVLEAAGELAPLPSEPVALEAARGRVLAEDVVSQGDLPPFDPSAMDGYALVAGPAGEFALIGESRAGHPFEGRVEPGSAVRISTGAPLPAGADTVVPLERAGAEAGGRVSLPASEPGANVRRAGEDVRAGELVLRAGSEIGPAEAGILAALGRASAPCARRPRVAVVVTGDELVEPGAPLGPGQITGSNGVALAAQVEAAGGVVARREQVPDDPEATLAALARALESSEVVCVSGGISVGPHDHVRAAFGELGAEERFWGVALKPGKPTWFGVRERALAFGLPGNPVSAMVTFQLFVRPALRTLVGADPLPPRGSALLEGAVKLSPEREQAVRVHLSATDSGWSAAPTGAQESHRMSSMLGAAALALIPRGEGELPAGARVDIELLA